MHYRHSIDHSLLSSLYCHLQYPLCVPHGRRTVVCVKPLLVSNFFVTWFFSFPGISHGVKYFLEPQPSLLPHRLSPSPPLLLLPPTPRTPSAFPWITVYLLSRIWPNSPFPYASSPLYKRLLFLKSLIMSIMSHHSTSSNHVDSSTLVPTAGSQHNHLYCISLLHQLTPLQRRVLDLLGPSFFFFLFLSATEYFLSRIMIQPGWVLSL